MKNRALRSVNQGHWCSSWWVQSTSNHWSSSRSTPYLTPYIIVDEFLGRASRHLIHFLFSPSILSPYPHPTTTPTPALDRIRPWFNDAQSSVSRYLTRLVHLWFPSEPSDLRELSSSLDAKTLCCWCWSASTSRTIRLLLFTSSYSPPSAT